MSVKCFKHFKVQVIRLLSVHNNDFFVFITIKDDSLSAVDSMTSLLLSEAQVRNTTDVPLITKSAVNLGSCLNNMLKAGAARASGNSAKYQASGNHGNLKQCEYTQC